MMGNRWLLLAAGCVIQTVLGGIYAWSAFVPYLTAGHGLTTGQCGFIFGLTIMVFTSAMILAGRVLVKYGPRLTALIAALLFAAGYGVAATSGGSFIGLVLGLGCLAGCGIGFGYVCPLSVGMKGFPRQKGLVTGVIVAGFGSGAVVLASLARLFLSAGMDVLVFLGWVGFCSGSLLFVAALLLWDPVSTATVPTVPGCRPAIFSRAFGFCAAGIFSGTFAGLLIIGNLSPILFDAGLSERQAAAAISIFAVGNGIGRIVWGRLFDRRGFSTIPLSLWGLGVFAGVLLLPVSPVVLFVAIGAAGFCFGANFVLYASAVSRCFGLACFPLLYPVCFLAYGVAGLIAPGLGGFLADVTGSFRLSIGLCIGLVVGVGALCQTRRAVFSQP